MITFVYTYYDNPTMLGRQLLEWLSYPANVRREIHFLVVDDGSEKKPALPVVQSVMQGAWGKIDLSLYRINVNIPWNQDGARNLGMKNLRPGDEWALLCDIDHMVQVDQVEALLALDMNRKLVSYMPGQRTVGGKDVGRVHPNIYLMRQTDYWMIGGYDEDFAGWYGSDGNFHRLMREWGIRHVCVPDKVKLTVFRSEDIEDANTKDWGRKRSPYVLKMNKALIAKARGPRYKPTNHIRFPWERLI